MDKKANHILGAFDGTVGDTVGISLGDGVGLLVGAYVGLVGDTVGSFVGDGVGDVVG